MDRMLVAVFDSEKKAYEGRKALLQLDNEGSITLYAYAVVTKKADGTVSIKNEDDPGPLGTLLGTTVGGLVALLGGPAAAVVGAASGLALGGFFDIDHIRVGEDFVEDVVKVLTPNKVAVIAEIDEEWTTPVDTRLEALGGTVFRRAQTDARQTSNDEEVAAMKADVTQMKAEASREHAQRKAKISEKIKLLEDRIQKQSQKAKERRQTAEKQAKAKQEILKKKAKTAGRAIRDFANTPV